MVFNAFSICILYRNTEIYYAFCLLGFLYSLCSSLKNILYFNTTPISKNVSMNTTHKICTKNLIVKSYYVIGYLTHVVVVTSSDAWYVYGSVASYEYNSLYEVGK